MPTTMGDVITFHLAPAARAELDALAREQHRDPGELLSEAVTAYLDVQRRDAAAIRQGLQQAEAGDFASDAEIKAVYATFR